MAPHELSFIFHHISSFNVHNLSHQLYLYSSLKLFLLFSNFTSKADTFSVCLWVEGITEKNASIPVSITLKDNMFYSEKSCS